MADPVLNFAEGIISAGFSSTDTSFTLQSGHGNRFPDPSISGSYNLVIYNSTDFPNIITLDGVIDPSIEFIRISTKVSDTLSFTLGNRGQEGTVATNHNTSGKVYKASLSFTKKAYDDLVAGISSKQDIIASGTTGQYYRGDKSWATLDKSAVGLSLVENTALSTWAGTPNITSVGTIASGTWSGTAVGVAKGGTGQTTADAALDALLPSQTSMGGKFLTTDGSNNVSWGTAGSSNSTTKDLTAGEALTAGNFVNIYNDAGTAKVRKASSTLAYRADGYVIAGASSGATVTVYFDKINSGLSSLTIGNLYFIDSTAGGVTSTSPSSMGNMVQRVGIAVSATEIPFIPGEPIILG